MSIENRFAQNAGILSSRCVRTALHQILIPRRRVNTFESSFAGEGSLQNNSEVAGVTFHCLLLFFAVSGFFSLHFRFFALCAIYRISGIFATRPASPGSASPRVGDVLSVLFPNSSWLHLVLPPGCSLLFSRLIAPLLIFSFHKL